MKTRRLDERRFQIILLSAAEAGQTGVRVVIQVRVVEHHLLDRFLFIAQLWLVEFFEYVHYVARDGGGLRVRLISSFRPGLPREEILPAVWVMGELGPVEEREHDEQEQDEPSDAA
ncbi:hypothetical protein PtA15_8A447 [Puccinia triticina]|uniref:Uncharacterized protein n=1 Tax=Puccinia triticina TaxID=208348 RepID=A0ABY7CRI3_9BASI|nr:uncharacterized protein PtA15_8A447 [Puccinia triticina]WAQ87543.1 hypothetical protein PtA15_8A447 [Puccinia triticina]WAR57393.1 hypothetical protein PtB15_8B440 [Puccinia triticina]